MPFKAVSVRSHTPLHTTLQPSKHPLKSLRACLTVTVLSASLAAGSKLKVLLAAVFRIVNNLVILSSNGRSKLIKPIMKKLLLGTTST